MSQANAPYNAQHAELRQLSEQWGKGLLSTDEAMGWLLAYLARQSADEPARAPELNTQNLELKTPSDEPAHTPKLKTQNSKLKTPSEALGSLLRQIGDTLDALAGPHLDLWRVGDLWYWRWEDTCDLSAHGLRSLGEALADAVEQRHPGTFPAPPGKDI
ncbi:MAG TPA: hypothetical protein VFS21_17755 [Roseiflexaceae bacterium]|nr:hypothetical protein [Roseiflexaceae bacterium]